VTTFGYDDRGNRVSAAGTAGDESMVYDVADRLISWARPDHEGRVYAYDGDGLLSSAAPAEAGGVTSEGGFVWDPTPGIAQLLSDGGRDYLYGVALSPLAQRGAGEGVRFLHADSMGSIRLVTDAEGDVLAESDYHPFGQVDETVSATAPAVATESRFGYVGEYTDVTGLIYLRARWLDPATAQFVSVDPIVMTTGSPYGYTGGNPLSFADHSGLDWLEDLSSWVAGFGDAVTFGGTAQIRRLINYLVWGEDDDMVDHCSVFYEWGGYGGQVANLGLLAIGTVEVGAALVQRMAQATRMAEGAASGGAAANGGLVLEGLGGAAGGPKPSPQFLKPTNPPQPPPPGARVQGPTAQYPNGYWRLQNEHGAYIDPSTGKPPSNVSRAEARARTHIELPPGWFD
jgi:RHS repeat-associated protein